MRWTVAGAAPVEGASSSARCTGFRFHDSRAPDPLRLALWMLYVFHAHARGIVIRWTVYWDILQLQLWCNPSGRGNLVSQGVPGYGGTRVTLAAGHITLQAGALGSTIVGAENESPAGRRPWVAGSILPSSDGISTDPEYWAFIAPWPPCRGGRSTARRSRWLRCRHRTEPADWSVPRCPPPVSGLYGLLPA